VDRIVELPRLPVRHANAAVRRRFPGQVASVQSVAGQELDEKRHGRAEEVSAARARMFPHIDV